MQPWHSVLLIIITLIVFGAGFYYDPNRKYFGALLAGDLTYDGTAVTHEGAIPSSFGMDFIEVRLDPTVSRQPLTVKFEGEGNVARFNVEIWKLGRGEEKPSVPKSQAECAPGDAHPCAFTLQPKPFALTPQPETVPQNQDGAHGYVIPSVDTTTIDRLALIITRLDADETTDPAGKYRVTLASEAEAES